MRFTQYQYEDLQSNYPGFRARSLDSPRKRHLLPGELIFPHLSRTPDIHIQESPGLETYQPRHFESLIPGLIPVIRQVHSASQ